MTDSFETAMKERAALLASLNVIEDAYADQDNPEAVFAIMQAKADIGLPVHREGWE